MKRRARRQRCTSKYSARTTFTSSCRTTASPNRPRSTNGLHRGRQGVRPQLVATNDVHYIEKEHHRRTSPALHRHGHDDERPEADAVPVGAVLLESPGEMKALLREFPEALNNTLDVAAVQRARSTSQRERHFFRTFGEMPERVTRRAEYLAEARARRPSQALTASKDIEHPNRRRTEHPHRGTCLEFETRRHRENRLHLITSSSSGISSDYGREHGHSRRSGRGSGAGCSSPICWRSRTWIRIRYGLLFERFLNPERVNPPDIDIDFCRRPPRRGHRIRAAEIRARLRRADHHLRHDGREDGRSATSAVSWDLTYGEGDRLAKMIPDESRR